jgi:hypothetical protein
VAGIQYDPSMSDVQNNAAGSSPSTKGLSLRTLAPEYVADSHKMYVKTLEKAVGDRANRNIALTGAYGTGKSSVLTKFAEKYPARVLQLSLSSVGVEEIAPAGSSDANPAAWTKTNRIQKEIVKQILYRDPPEHMRGSRFRRIARFSFLREPWIAVAGGLLILAILFLTGLSRPLAAVAGTNGWAVALFYVFLFILASGVVFALRWVTHNRVFLERVSAAAATVTLSAESSSFFDQYMDEIVYYFEQSGRDIVIF